MRTLYVCDHLPTVQCKTEVQLFFICTSPFLPPHTRAPHRSGGYGDEKSIIQKKRMWKVLSAKRVFLGYWSTRLCSTTRNAHHFVVLLYIWGLLCLRRSLRLYSEAKITRQVDNSSCHSCAAFDIWFWQTDAFSYVCFIGPEWKVPLYPPLRACMLCFVILLCRCALFVKDPSALETCSPVTSRQSISPSVPMYTRALCAAHTNKESLSVRGWILLVPALVERLLVVGFLYKCASFVTKASTPEASSNVSSFQSISVIVPATHAQCATFDLAKLMRFQTVYCSRVGRSHISAVESLPVLCCQIDVQMCFVCNGGFDSRGRLKFHLDSVHLTCAQHSACECTLERCAIACLSEFCTGVLRLQQKLLLRKQAQMSHRFGPGRRTSLLVPTVWFRQNWCVSKLFLIPVWIVPIFSPMRAYLFCVVRLLCTCASFVTNASTLEAGSNATSLQFISANVLTRAQCATPLSTCAATWTDTCARTCARFAIRWSATSMAATPTIGRSIHLSWFHELDQSPCGAYFSWLCEIVQNNMYVLFGLVGTRYYACERRITLKRFQVVIPSVFSSMMQLLGSPLPHTLFFVHVIQLLSTTVLVNAEGAQI